MSLICDFVCWVLSLLLIGVGKAKPMRAGTIPYTEGSGSGLCKTEKKLCECKQDEPIRCFLTLTVRVI